MLRLRNAFLRRYPKEKLLKNPKLRTKDIETTRAACKRLIDFPTTLINFAEGSRYTEEKQRKRVHHISTYYLQKLHH